MQCPWEECRYIRKDTDTAPMWQCPLCLNAYNKHPDFFGNIYFEITLHFNFPPKDSEIQTDKLTLYMNKGYLEGAIKEKSRIQKYFFNKENLTDYLEIITILRNKSGSLNEKLIHNIFIATAKLNKENLEKIENYKEKKTATFKVLLYAFFIIMGFICLYLSRQEPDKTNKSANNLLYTEETKSYPHSSEDPGIDLIDFNEKLSLAEGISEECKKSCQASNLVPESCKQLTAVLEKISSTKQLYRQFLKNKSVDRLSKQNQELVVTINDKLWAISNNMDLAKKFCAQYKINQSANEKQTTTNSNSIENQDVIDFTSKDIHLDILYSKIYAANMHLRNCRASCESQLKNMESCYLFINLSKEYTPELEQVFEIIKSSKNNISLQDKEILRKISFLLDDSQKERQNLYSCIQIHRN